MKKIINWTKNHKRISFLALGIVILFVSFQFFTQKDKTPLNELSDF